MVVKLKGSGMVVVAELGCVWLMYGSGSIEIKSILPKGRGMTLQEKVESIEGELMEQLLTLSSNRKAA